MRPALPIFPDTYRILSQADKRTVLNMLFCVCKINRETQAKVIEEMKALRVSHSKILVPMKMYWLFAYPQLKPEIIA